MEATAKTHTVTAKASCLLRKLCF